MLFVALLKLTAMQFGHVQRLDDGDEMHASSLGTHAEDRQDATYVRVSDSDIFK
jgi:hypothetical protein